jgi:hypothetical protein
MDTVEIDTTLLSLTHLNLISASHNISEKLTAFSLRLKYVAGLEHIYYFPFIASCESETSSTTLAGNTSLINKLLYNVVTKLLSL